MFDLAVTGGTVVDGTGTPGRRADLGVRDGRIVSIAAPGALGEAARHTIDADGLVVAPGFVDIHTHLDAQVFWDPWLTPTSLHGITTVVGGNCGFSIAPLTDADGDYVMRMLARVEGMPLESLRTGVPWGWNSTSQYLDAVDRARPALNMAFMAGHSTMRRVVMGDAAAHDRASATQVEQMRRLLSESLAGGAIGFSSSWTASHVDGDGNPVPSRSADEDEILALCAVAGEYEGTQVEFIPCGFPDFQDRHRDLMTKMSQVSARPVNWNILLVISREATDERLAMSEYAAQHGARIVALAYPGPIASRYTFVSSAFDSVPNWSEIMALEAPAKLHALADPAVRERLRAGLNSPEGRRREIAAIERHTVVQGFSPASKAVEGRVLGEVAAERGVDSLDLLLDLMVADDLRTGMAPRALGDDPSVWPVREQLWRDPRVVIGASDAGAHLDILSTFDYAATYLELTRDRSEIPIETAVQRLTDAPSRLYGLRERGRIAEGWLADLCLFDAAGVAQGTVGWRDDLPGGFSRLYSEPAGIEHVVVNGVEIARHGRPLDARPGRVLRSGRDTMTVLP
ncbi:MAG: aminoacylase [Actinobacteria bacterium]|nr:MAG: aminoacylase [Actinomycetota bacterium]